MERHSGALKLGPEQMLFSAGFSIRRGATLGLTITLCSSVLALLFYMPSPWAFFSSWLRNREHHSLNHNHQLWMWKAHSASNSTAPQQWLSPHSITGASERQKHSDAPDTSLDLAGGPDFPLQKALLWGDNPLHCNPSERHGCSATFQKWSVAQAAFCFNGAKKPHLSSLALKGIAPSAKAEKSRQQWDVMSQFLPQMTDHTGWEQFCCNFAAALNWLLRGQETASTKSHQAMVYLASYLQLQMQL